MPNDIDYIAVAYARNPESVSEEDKRRLLETIERELAASRAEMNAKIDALKSPRH